MTSLKEKLRRFRKKHKAKISKFGQGLLGGQSIGSALMGVIQGEPPPQAPPTETGGNNIPAPAPFAPPMNPTVLVVAGIVLLALLLK